MRVTSREYKVIVDRSFCIDLAAALSDIFDDVRDLARPIGVGCSGAFDAAEPKERTILFLDTLDFTLRQNGLLLRQRVKRQNGTTEYTLKCRTEDRYIAASRELSPGLGLRHDSKFEEDIGFPFVSRFSHSTTVTLDDDEPLGGEKFPGRLSTAARLFPELLAIHHNGLPCAPQTTLAPVHGLKTFERVFTGPTVHFPNQCHHASSTPATVALVLWSKGKKGRILTAEFSFRYEDKNEAFPPEVASAARRFFEGLQHLDWTQPEASSKTQYMYGSK